MNSRVDKITDSSTKFNLSGWVTGRVLHQKLEMWCSVEKAILMHEITFSQMAEKIFLPISSEDPKAKEALGGWIIEFNIVKASSVAPDNLYDGVCVLSGLIKDSVELINGKSQKAYFIKITSRNFAPYENVFIDAFDIYQVLSMAGIRSLKA
jgi:hypothetical protein